MESALATVEPTMGIIPEAAYLAARRVALSAAEATTLCIAITAARIVPTMPTPHIKTLFSPFATLSAPPSDTEATKPSEKTAKEVGKRAPVQNFSTKARVKFILNACVDAVVKAPDAVLIAVKIGIAEARKSTTVVRLWRRSLHTS